MNLVGLTRDQEFIEELWAWGGGEVSFCVVQEHNIHLEQDGGLLRLLNSPSLNLELSQVDRGLQHRRGFV